MDEIALFFHLLGAFSFVAGTIVAGVAFETARRRKTPAEIALLLWARVQAEIVAEHERGLHPLPRPLVVLRVFQNIRQDVLLAVSAE